MSIVLFFLTFFNQTATYDVYIAKPEQISFHYRQNGKNINTLPALAKTDPLIKFACNIQMYSGGRKGKDTYPVGLYIENGKQIAKLRKVNNPKVNFGMQPQAVFAITKNNKAVLTPVSNVSISTYKYAVQLAPMLVIETRVNPKLTKSESRFIRNGVGILKDGRVLFAMSNEPVTFQEFAKYFIAQGCVTASYVDGAVSETWRPGKANEYPGEFAVMAAVRR